MSLEYVSLERKIKESEKILEDKLSIPCTEYTKNIQQRELLRNDFECSYRTTYFHLQNVGVKTYVDNLEKSVIHNIRYSLYSEKFRNNQIEIPENWTDYFKIKWFPKWLLKKFPARYKKLGFEFDVYYPNFKPILPENIVVVTYLDHFPEFRIPE